MGVTLEELSAAKRELPASLGEYTPGRVMLSELSSAEPSSQNVPTPPMEGADAAPEDQPFLKRAGEYATSPGGARLATEIGLGLTGAGLATRVGVMGAKYLSASGALRLGKWGRIGLQAIGGGVGEGGGSLVSEAFDPTPEGQSPLARAAVTGGVAATGEGLGGAGYQLWRKARKGGTKLVPHGATAVEDLAEHGLTPGLASDSFFVDFLEKASEKSAVGGGVIRRSREKAVRAQQAEATGLANRLKSPMRKEHIGEAIVDLRENGFDSFKAGAEIKARGLDKMREEAGLGGVDITDTVELATEILAEAEDTIKNPAKAKIARNILAMVTPEKEVGTGIVDAAGNEIMRTIPADNTVSWERAQKLRSQLLRVSRTGVEPIAGEAQASGKRIAPVIDREMERAARDAGGKIYRKWREFNAFWRNGAETFNSSLMRSIASSDAERVYDIAIKGQRPGTIRRVRHMILRRDLKGPERKAADAAWQNVQGQFLIDIMSKHAGPDGITNASAVISELNRFGDDSLRELFPSGEWRQFRRMMNNQAITQGGVGKGTPGGVMMQLQQAGAFIALVTGTIDPATASVFFVAPWAASRLFTNEKFVRWATIGAKAPPGSARAREAFQRMSQIHAALIRNSAQGGEEESKAVSTYRTALP